MNNDIRNALLDLFSACLEVNGAGYWHAHMGYSGHVDKVHVNIVPATTLYAEGSDYEYELYEDVYICRTLGGTPEQVAANIAELAAKVNEFLQPAKEEAA